MEQLTRMRFFSIILLLLSLAFMETEQGMMSSPEETALLSLRASIVDGFGHLHNWVGTDSSPCRWNGVLCNVSGSVVALNLSFMNLSGSISQDIGRLENLVNLTLSVNNFTGPLPVEVTNINGLRYLNISNNAFNESFPVNFSKLQVLEVLDAYNNNFSGQLPLEISHLTSLKHLHLGGNYFSGSIPPQYSNLESLLYLALSGNSLTGRIPPELGNMANLEQMYIGYFNQYDGGIPVELSRLSNLVRLDAANCGLGGSIPPELGSLTKLDSLFLQINSLTGTIPSQLGNLTNLKSLDLSNNQLTGQIPDEFQKLEKMELLSLFRNHLHGDIPFFMGDLPRLQVLYLWENNLTGAVPEHLGRNGELLMIDVSSNSFTGLVPPDLCFGGKLQRLILLDNQFSGPIPESLGRCPTLDRIRLGHNFLNGSIPPVLFKLPSIQIIELPYNQLSGNFPPNLAFNTKLGRLDLSNNLLSGVIPASIGNLTGLQTLLMPQNMLSGSIPPEIRNMKRLSKLDLSHNLLVGSLPPEVGECVDLTILDLSQNQLSGEIPPQLENLTVLDFLNLSRNHLNGSIPSSLQNMLSLTAADFSYNNLTGPIPGQGQFANFNSSSFVGNAGLCGSQLILCSMSDSATQSYHHHVKPEPKLIYWVVLAVISSLTIIVLVGGIFCNRHAFCSLLGRENIERPWKLTAFQRLEFTATHVLDCLTDENIIGKGGAGTVYKCMMPSGEFVAVKRLPGICKGSSCDHGFSAEIQTLGKIRHRHIVRLLGCCSNQETNLLVYEYMPNGSLGELLHGPRVGTLDWSTRYRIGVEAAKGLCYLHHDCSPLIVHRDVKSNNILLDSNFEAHVADFGLAKVLQDNGKSESMSSIAGSYGYIAPEYAYTLKVDEKSDIYSFGVVLLELLTGRRPIEPEYGDGVDIAQWVKKKVQTRDGTLDVLDSRMRVAEGSDQMQEVMLVLRVALLCLVDLPMQRPTMRDVVQLLTDVPKNKETKDASRMSPPDLISI